MIMASLKPKKKSSRLQKEAENSKEQEGEDTDILTTKVAGKPSLISKTEELVLKIQDLHQNYVHYFKFIMKKNQVNSIICAFSSS